MDDRAALITLILANGALGPRHRLAFHEAGPAQALRAGPMLWKAVGCTPAQRARLAQPDHTAIDRTLRWLDPPGHHLLPLPALPLPLRVMAEAPLALFVHGDPGHLAQPLVAVVGSRSPTPSGRALAAEFSTAFARTGLTVLSGLAAGIDGAAHEAALNAGGTTVAIVGNGLDEVYPPHHRHLQATIATRGAVVSEYAPGTSSRPAHFPARNRLVATLGLATLVVEAAKRSGALITARLAAEAGREVCAIPGSVRNPRAQGCHRLIREGAALVETPEEVFALLAPALSRDFPALAAGDLQKPVTGPTERGRQHALPPSLAGNADYQCLWKALDHDPTPMDCLIRRSGLTAVQLSSMLLAMELAGIVVCEHGRYCRNPGFPTSTASKTQAEGQ